MPVSKHFGLILALLALLCGCAPVAHAPATPPAARHPKSPEYSFQSLGTLGGNFSYPTGINDAGEVVGFSCTWGNCDDRAFLYSQGRMRQLGTLAKAEGIDRTGSVVCIGSKSDGTVRACLYRSGKVVPIAFSDVWPMAINERGDVVGQLSLPGGQRRACVIRNGRLLDLGTLGGRDSLAGGISESGLIVGSSTAGGRFEHAFLWADGRMRDLGTLDNGYSFAKRVNDRGQVVGNASAGPAVWHAFLWERGKMVDLGTLGGRSSEANDINSAGEIVGGADVSSGSMHAFRLWKGKMQDLNDLVDASGDGWELVTATAINDIGQIAVYADGPSGTHAGLLTPLTRVKPLGSRPLGRIAASPPLPARRRRIM